MPDPEVPSSSKGRILVAEDEPHIRRILATILEAGGYEVDQAGDGNEALEILSGAGVEVQVRHAACSAAALLFTRTHLDLARVGISLYGLWPSRETYVACLERGRPRFELRPALTWKTRIAQVKSVEEGSFVGYGCTYRTTRPSRIQTT